MQELKKVNWNFQVNLHPSSSCPSWESLLLPEQGFS